MKYYATFIANNGNTWLQTPWEYTNKAKAILETPEIRLHLAAF